MKEKNYFTAVWFYVYTTSIYSNNTYTFLTHTEIAHKDTIFAVNDTALKGLYHAESTLSTLG